MTFRFGRPSFSEALLTQANKSGCPFQGTMTPDTRIPLNQGICGAAASAGKTIVVDDVAADAPCLFPRDQIGNRRSCFVHGKVAGEPDIDSHFSRRLWSRRPQALRACRRSARKNSARDPIISRLSMICLARGLGHRRRYRQRKCALHAQRIYRRHHIFVGCSGRDRHIGVLQPSHY